MNENGIKVIKIISLYNKQQTQAKQEIENKILMH